ncbi:electron transport complex subunit RsxB [Clostridium homopropionicum DSM 5847]|uniref:Electron transport complex subunit RsxB n=1 Tax=Clostridium homopropionicum DSM 5847 TaxID=1121318 RepID=A0A0L6Z8K1_9CLOT|nr:permease [Clostridium homopropionicum]KOA19296.1 electron transport complex subunit RsxB [Clostridium homopropionicum DSM 5847]SFG20183.1 4Fe-4S single cluster domain of Ferredoxin I [Clostridium homopropionicum]
MSLLIKKVKSNIFLTLVIFTYIFLMIFMPEKGIQSFSNSLYYVKEMLIIMPVILLLTSLIEAWVPKNTIQNALGEGSGVKGFLFSFLLGSFSAGPIYAAFPVCKMLIKKGASIANIVIILSAWAVIKIPMLANESKFLGPKFMLVRWVLTTISILIISIIISKIVKKEDLPIHSAEENKDGILSVNEHFCIGCGLCTRLSPDDFILENKKAKVNKKILKEDKNEKVKLAIDKCPAKAIDYV